MPYWPVNPGIRVRLLEYSGWGERLVASSSKVSLSRKPVEDILSMDEGEVEKWIVETFRRMHFSPWEHSSYTFLLDGISRVASHQLVRHRIASYTQQSHRYTEGYLRDSALRASCVSGLGCPEKPKGGRREAYSCYSRALRLVAVDGSWEDLVYVGWASHVPPYRAHGEGLSEYYRGVLLSLSSYYKLLSSGVPREDARLVIPGGVRTRVVVTMNARELVQSFLPLRTCTKAQWEIRLAAWLLLEELARVHPRLFKWAGPSCVLRENTSRQTPSPLENYLAGDSGFTVERCPELVESKRIPACLRVARQILDVVSAPEPASPRGCG